MSMPLDVARCEGRKWIAGVASECFTCDRFQSYDAESYLPAEQRPRVQMIAPQPFPCQVRLQQQGGDDGAS